MFGDVHFAVTVIRTKDNGRTDDDDVTDKGTGDGTEGTAWTDERTEDDDGTFDGTDDGTSVGQRTTTERTGRMVT